LFGQKILNWLESWWQASLVVAAGFAEVL
jgi:hypothetical protein